MLTPTKSLPNIARRRHFKSECVFKGGSLRHSATAAAELPLAHPKFESHLWDPAVPKTPSGFGRRLSTGHDNAPRSVILRCNPTAGASECCFRRPARRLRSTGHSAPQPFWRLKRSTGPEVSWVDRSRPFPTTRNPRPPSIVIGSYALRRGPRQGRLRMSYVEHPDGCIDGYRSAQCVAVLSTPVRRLRVFATLHLHRCHSEPKKRKKSSGGTGKYRSNLRMQTVSQRWDNCLLRLRTKSISR